MPLGARISWLRRELARLPALGGALPLDTGVGFFPEPLEAEPEAALPEEGACQIGRAHV